MLHGTLFDTDANDRDPMSNELSSLPGAGLFAKKKSSFWNLSCLYSGNV